ncbi:MAG: hypothetical protein HY842_19605, partial [Bacteroidetes bacterium]|nr:hypothetical protein [Bacteroidota bacterium]
MANITYLIGAGASANALPVVSDMKNRMQVFLNFLKSHSQKAVVFNGISDGDQNKIINDFHSILNEAFSHSTPDTYAKKLWLKDETENLQSLKFFLSLYFLFEQSGFKYSPSDGLILDSLPEYLANNEMSELIRKVEKSRDYRYDVFFATLLEKNENVLKMPNTINIVSWNYDLQFELGYCDFDNPSKLTAMSNLNIVPMNELSTTNGNIVKMNGMA